MGWGWIRWLLDREALVGWGVRGAVRGCRLETHLHQLATICIRGGFPCQLVSNDVRVVRCGAIVARERLVQVALLFFPGEGD